MKIQIALFATVLAAALFWMGCATTKETLREPVVNQENTETKNGLTFLKAEDQPFTGTVRLYVNGIVNIEYQVKEGLRHGYCKFWFVGGNKSHGGLSRHEIYENGKITFNKRWYYHGKQEELGGFNSDGSRKR